MLSNRNTRCYYKIQGSEVRHMALDHLSSEQENGAWYCALIGTVIYVLLFFPLLAVLFCFTMIAFENLATWPAILTTTMYCSILLSLPASIFLMWLSYVKHYYSKTYAACMLPILFFFTLVFIEWVFHTLVNLVVR